MTEKTVPQMELKIEADLHITRDRLHRSERTEEQQEEEVVLEVETASMSPKEHKENNAKVEEDQHPPRRSLRTRRPPNKLNL